MGKMHDTVRLMINEKYIIVLTHKHFHKTHPHIVTPRFTRVVLAL
jgi:hypothetical protein